MKLYFILGACIAFLGVSIGAYISGYKHGENGQIAKYERLKNKYEAQGQELASAVEKANQKARIVYRTKIEKVKEAVDPTKCADTPIPSQIMEQLK